MMFWAVEHPLRLRILEFADREGQLSLSASELKEALEGEFENLQIDQVAYQLAQLRDAELLPRPMRRS